MNSSMSDLELVLYSKQVILIKKQGEIKRSFNLLESNSTRL